MGAKSKVDEEAAYSFTSMIDVVFLLLIFFILQPFKSPEMKLKCELPKDVGPAKTPDIRNNVRVSIRKARNSSGADFGVNTKVIGSDVTRLANAILEAAGHDHEVAVAIAADPKVKFEHVLLALDQCHVAEMKKVSFEAPPPQNAKKRNK